MPIDLIQMRNEAQTPLMENLNRGQQSVETSLARIATIQEGRQKWAVDKILSQFQEAETPELRQAILDSVLHSPKTRDLYQRFYGDNWQSLFLPTKRTAEEREAASLEDYKTRLQAGQEAELSSTGQDVLKMRAQIQADATEKARIASLTQLGRMSDEDFAAFQLAESRRRREDLLQQQQDTYARTWVRVRDRDNTMRTMLASQAADAGLPFDISRDEGDDAQREMQRQAALQKYHLAAIEYDNYKRDMGARLGNSPETVAETQKRGQAAVRAWMEIINASGETGILYTVNIRTPNAVVEQRVLGFNSSKLEGVLQNVHRYLTDLQYRKSSEGQTLYNNSKIIHEQNPEIGYPIWFLLENYPPSTEVTLDSKKLGRFRKWLDALLGKDDTAE